MKTAKKRVIPVDIIEEIESTNTYLKENCEHLPDRYTLRARLQSAGRGRFSREWITSPGDDLTFSTLVPVDKKLHDILIHVPQITALSLFNILLKYDVKCEIKWPNDILVSGKKLAGILVEGVFQGGNQYLVVGIGLNVNNRILSEIDIPATSLLEVINNRIEPHEIMLSIIDELYDNIDKLKESGFNQFRESLEMHMAYRNEIKDFMVSGKKMSGEILGIDDDGALLVQTENGEVHSLISGEISFRC